MTNSMKAIILGAGIGKRLLPLTKDIPKGLIEIGGKTILEHQIDSLVDCGVSDIVLVVGHGAESVKKKLGNRVRYIYNPDYKNTNNIFSLWLARDEMKDNDCLCFHSDILFQEKILKDLIEHTGDICLSVEEKDRQEMIRVKVKDKLITEIGKPIPYVEAYGNFIGLAKFSAIICDGFIKKMTKYIQNNKTQMFFTAPINNLIKNNIQVHPILTNGLFWYDIDSKKDYEEAKQALKRKILE